MTEPYLRCPYCPWGQSPRDPDMSALDDADLATHLTMNHTARADLLPDFLRDARERYVIAPRRRAKR